MEASELLVTDSIDSTPVSMLPESVLEALLAIKVDVEVRLKVRLFSPFVVEDSGKVVVDMIAVALGGGVEDGIGEVETVTFGGGGGPTVFGSVDRKVVQERTIPMFPPGFGREAKLGLGSP